MKLEIFNRKPIVGEKGNESLDLTYPSLKFKTQLADRAFVYVKESDQMRPDMMSFYAYGSVSLYDLLLKYNGISNPFSLEMGDILFVADLDGLVDQLVPSGREDPVSQVIRKQYIDSSKASKKDTRLQSIENKRKEAIQKRSQASSSPSTNNLPPNIAEEGDREVVIKGGKIYFGPDVSRNKQECEEPLSKSEFLARLIKNRINGS
jgi:hypothetical protein